MTTELGIEVLPGDVVKVFEGRKKIVVFVTMTLKDGGFYGIPASPLAYQAAGWKLAGRVDELVRHKREISDASKPFLGAQVFEKLDANPFAAKQFAA